MTMLLGGFWTPGLAFPRQISLQLGNFVVVKAGQRRAFARQTCLHADIHQFLTVELQFFR